MNLGRNSGVMKWPLLIAAAAIGLASLAWAEEVDQEKAEYLSRCAACHGIDARGKGTQSAKLKAAAPDLTLLARNNKGVFPVSAVYAAIDRRTVVQGHGIDEMPIWGCRYTSPAARSERSARPKLFKPETYESHLDLACDSEDIIANRILSIVDYLRRIQAQ